MSGDSRKFFRLQAGAWAALLILCSGVLGYEIGYDEDVPFLPTAGGANWIMAPLPRSADMIVVDPTAPPVHVFIREFDAPEGAVPMRVRGRALREAKLELNGEAIPQKALGSTWKEGFEANLGGRLRPGRNELRVAVTHARGPALLQLEFLDSGSPLGTDGRWLVLPGRELPGPAVIARDSSLHPESRLLPPALEVLEKRAGLLLLLFVATTALARWAPRWFTPARQRWAPHSMLGIMTLFWLILFFTKFRFIPLNVGFDGPAHLVYVENLLQKASLPTAAYGFSTYHPPLFYLLTAGLHSLFGDGTIVYRAIPFLSGLANIWLVAWLARRLWPREALRPCLAIASAGLLPMNLYMSAYVSNEPLHAALISLALALAAAILWAPQMRPAKLAALILTLAAGLLTKFTSLLLAPLIAFFVALRVWWLDGRGPLRATLSWGFALGTIGLLSGWFYLRNFLLFGDPLVWNLDLPDAPSWWMRPGFHTAAFFNRFGESLSHPNFAGYASFWDGVYSTLWGDGLVAGMARISTRHGFWNDDFMILTYPLALPATVLIIVGALRLWFQSFRESDLARRLLLSLLTSVLFLLAFALVLICLQLPFYAQAKAFYLLAAVLPLSLASAEGLAAAPAAASRAGFPWASALFYGWLGTLGGVIGLAHLG